MMRIRPEYYRVRSIFNRVIELWPDEINIEDGVKVVGQQGLFPNLSKCWDFAEEKGNLRELSEIDNLGIWASFCCLHEMACKRFRGGAKEIRTSDIRIARFDFEMQRNLFDKVWQKERLLYLSVNEERHSVKFTEGKKLVFSEFVPSYREIKN